MLHDQQLHDRWAWRGCALPKRDHPNKGETLARTSAYWFDVLKEKGIPTHFIRLEKPNKMRVKRVNVISDYSKLNTSTKNYLIPLELITRYFVYGSLWDRVKTGARIRPSPEAGFSLITAGTRFIFY